MKTFIVLLTVCAMCSAQLTAVAILYGTSFDPSIRGYVRFSQADASSNVTVTAFITGITVNSSIPHGIHVHTYGDIHNQTSAGGHYNPFSQPHGCPEVNGTARHLGDMGNWEVSNGVVNQTKTLDLLQLTGSNSILGRAVVFHSQTDDCGTANTGNSGQRNAMGVIGYDIGQTAINTTATVVRATCYFTGNINNVAGFATLADDSNGLGSTITASVTGLNVSGQHGIHIHQYADVTDLNAGVGGHYNPFNTSHGIPPFTPRHVGDLGNIYYTNADGVTAQYYYVNNGLVFLNGPTSVIGRTVVIHAEIDNCVTYGARYSACVIGIAETAAFNNYIDTTAVPSGQNTSSCVVSTTASFTTRAVTTGSATTGSGASQVTMSMTLLVIFASLLALL